MGHKASKSKYFSFVIVPDKGGEPKTYRIKTAVLRAMIAAAVVLVVLIILGAATYWQMASLALENNRLREENFKLTKSVSQLENIKNELNKVKQFEKKLRTTLSGYVSIEQAAQKDSFDTKSLDFAKLGSQERKTIFRFVPSLTPVEGFIGRGYDASSLINEPHMGTDIAAATGMPIRAPADGVVMFSDWTVDGGNVLIILHRFGFVTLYKHNLRNLVGPMEHVTQGQVIALLGNTGKITSGPHLHIEIWKNGLPVDPINYIKGNNKS